MKSMRHMAWRTAWRGMAWHGWHGVLTLTASSLEYKAGLS